MKTQVGIIGLGKRGTSLLREVVLPLGMAEIVAVCDLYEDRMDRGCSIVEQAQGTTPKKFENYKDLIDYDEVEAVLVYSAWDNHVDSSVYAMQKGKPVGMEVCGAYCIEDCFRLVKAYEDTKTPFMFLENCCYGRRELMVKKMVEEGLFGEIVHASGGYHHDLRPEVTTGQEKRHYRFNNYKNRNCENYPTHELGPIAKVLGINKNNRMLYLTSTASKSVGLHDYIEKNMPDREDLMNTVFAQGDIVTTVIKCEQGQTITLTLDTSLPRFYSRGFNIRGTNGMYDEATDSVFIDSKEDMDFDLTWRNDCGGNASKYEEKYESDIWKKALAAERTDGHGGIDFLTHEAFFTNLQQGLPMDIDVYDAAAWMCITPLSEESIKNGSKPVEIPDFTINRK